MKAKILFRFVMTTSTILVSLQASAQGPNRIEVLMSQEERAAIGKSERAEVPRADLKILNANGQTTQALEISVQNRGLSSLKFPRKNLEISLPKSSDEKIKVDSISGNQLILSASPEDELVTHNMISYRLFQAAQVPALQTEYSEVVINNVSQGLYMITKAPADYLKKEQKAEVIFRRRYNDVIELKKADKSLSDAQVEAYRQALADVHEKAMKLTGKALVDSLSESIDMDQYMRWLAVNNLIHNGDYVDEVFYFGSRDANGKIKFKVMPWDLDDSFSKDMHMTLFGPNGTMKQISARQMLYGYESRIDRAISSNSELLKRYHSILKQVISEINDEKIDQIINEVSGKLEPYLKIPQILEAGRLDSQKQAHSPEAIRASLEEKRNFLKQQRRLIDNQLEQIAKESTSRATTYSAEEETRFESFSAMVYKMTAKKK